MRGRRNDPVPVMAIRGQVGDYDLTIRLAPEVKEDDEFCAGLCHAENDKAHVTISIDINQNSRAMLNTFLHEAIHTTEFVHGLNLKHHEVYTIASALTQIMVTSGIIKPAEFEARIRKLFEK